MKKVIVIGCPGSGKSTFSKKLAERTKLPLYHLDLLYWNADKTTVSKEIFCKRLKDVLQKSEWIIDGNYASTLEIRIKECDTVFFLDYPLDVCLDGIRSRQGKARSDMPWVENSDEIDRDFLEFIQRYETDNKPEVETLLQKYASREIYFFKTRLQSEEFLARIENR